LNLSEIVNDVGTLDDVLIPLIKAGKGSDSIPQVDKTRWSRIYQIDDIDKAVKETYKKHELLFGYDNMNAYNKVKSLVNERYKIIYNEIDNKYYIKVRGTKDWMMYTDLPIVDYLKSEEGIKGFSEKDLEAITDKLAARANPIKQYFDELPKWDGKTDYIKKFTDCFDTTDKLFFYEMLKKNLVRAIKCAMEADYENRYLMILVGGQQSGKTKAIQFLNPFYEDRGYGKYHSHAPLRMGDKDTIIQSSLCFFYNLEEFEMARGKEIAHIKQTISQGNTTIRPAYSKHEKEIIRRCTYWASTNKVEFLSDTENTRYLPIHLLNDGASQIRFREYKKIGLDEIWSQAYALYKKKGFDCELTSVERDWQESQNKLYNVKTYATETLNELFRRPEEGEYVQYLSLSDIKKEVAYILDDKNAANQYQLRDHLLGLEIPYKQYWLEGKNIGYKYALVRLKDGNPDFAPTHTGEWKA
jgi:predicted P-loop ATPase